MSQSSTMKIKLTKKNDVVGKKYLIRYKDMIAKNEYSLRLENFCRYIYTFHDFLYKTASYDRMRLFILYAIYQSYPQSIRTPFYVIARKVLFMYLQNQKIPTDFFIRYGTHSFSLTYNFHSVSPTEFNFNKKERVSHCLKPILLLCFSEQESNEIIDDIFYKKELSFLDKIKSHKYYKLIEIYLSEFISKKI